MSNFINEKRMMKQIGNFFSKPDNLIVEIAQNSQRAGATTLKLEFKDGVLTAEDNGHGAHDYHPLLVLADSEWNEEVMASSAPAGFGLYTIIASSIAVTFVSAFGRLTIDCQSFLDDEEYRASVEKLVVKEEGCQGFKIRAVLKEKPDFDYSALSFFPLNITVDGMPLERQTLAAHYGHHEIRTLYQGNEVFISPFNLSEDAAGLARALQTIWYGINIKGSGYMYVAIDVTKGSPLTPVLPYRESIKHDEKLQAFYDFARKTVVDYCIAIINGTRQKCRYKDQYKRENLERAQTRQLEQAMQTMERIATQEELDRLNSFYLISEDPFFEKRHVQRLIVGRGTTVISEKARLFLDKGECFEEAGTEDLFLQQGTILKHEMPSAHPAWLAVKEKEVVIRIKATKTYSGNYVWYKAAIECVKEIPVAAIYEGAYEGMIFYTGSPKDFNDLRDTVFEDRIVSEDIDSDSSETQRECFEKDVDDDMCKVLNEYSMDDLLLRIANVTSIDCQNIRDIKVDWKRRKLMVTGTRGKQSVINLAR